MDNPIKNLFGNFKLFGGGSGGSALGVDIGSSAIKVVEIKKRGGKAVLEGIRRRRRIPIQSCGIQRRPAEHLRKN